MTEKRTSRIVAFARRFPRLTRALGYITTVAVTFVFGFALATWNLVCRGTRCPSIEVLERYQPRQTSRLYAIDGRLVAELGVERRTLATLNEIPKVVQDAFVVTEDKRFYSHRGVDWFRIPGATITNIRAGSFVEGFSTITMQLARNIFPTKLTREKSPVRKLKEIRVARQIEKRYSKDKILELYLNQINLGAGAHGVETASQRYFGKPVRYLNLAEAATLAAIPKAPTRYNPRRFPARAVQRRNTIIELMRRDGAVVDQQASLAKAYPLALARRVESGEIAPYFAEWVRQTLHERFGDRLYEQGLKVYTTLDLDMQAAAERAVESQLRAIEGGRFGNFKHLTYEQYVARGDRDNGGSGAESPYIQAAFVAVDPRDGSVRAMVGGRDYGDSQFNRATQAMRQPGSTFKPITYATAIHQGKSPASIIDDSPISLPQLDGTDWTPENYDLKFLGPMTMRHGLYDSRNIVAIRVGMEVGEHNVVEMAQKFGITTPIPPYPSIHIGSAEVHPLEIIGGYTTFANLGTRTTPNAILRVEDSEGSVLWKTKPDSVPVLTTPEAWIMVNMMKDVVLRGTAVRVWNSGFRVPSAGKTGTTNDGADVWYVGFTANLVAGVWVGFDKPQKIMADAQGGRLASPAYSDFMIEVYRRKPEPPDWPRPASVTSRMVDSLTGLLVGPLCADRGYSEYFLAGTEPQGTCSSSASPGNAAYWMSRSPRAARSGGARNPR